MSQAIALSMGDPNGIGPEIAAKAWQTLHRSDHAPRFSLIADEKTAHTACQLFNLPSPKAITSWDQVASVFPNALPFWPIERQPGSQGTATATIKAIKIGVAATLAGQASAFVTCPISKARLYAEGFRHPGHTEFVAQLTESAPMVGARGPIMMLAAPELKVSLVTIHLSLKDAIAALSVERIVETIRITHQALQRDFAIPKPRLAVAGLNPHAGEGGALGEEDQAIIQPAIDQLKAEGINAFGPLPPDTMFHAEARATYDAAICMYHDQGLIPVKTLNFHGGVNATLGLPIVRTSPDHGTAFDIAGQGIARAESLIAALTLAQDMAHNRAHART